MSTITFSPELRRALGASVFYGTPAAAGAAAATFKSYVDPDAPNVHHPLCPGSSYLANPGTDRYPGPRNLWHPLCRFTHQASRDGTDPGPRGGTHPPGAAYTPPQSRKILPGHPGPDHPQNSPPGSPDRRPAPTTARPHLHP